MKIKSIQLKVALSAGACLLATAAVLIVYGLISARNTQTFVSQRVGKLLEAQSKQNLAAEAQAQAAAIQSALQDNLDTARTMPVTVVDHPLVRHKIGLLRQKNLDTKQFRDLTNEIARMLAYEATRDLAIEPVSINGWAGPVTVDRIAGKMITVVPILRAGLGMCSWASSDSAARRGRPKSFSHLPSRHMVSPVA